MDADMTFEEWVDHGVLKGWVGIPKCSMHDTLDLTKDEQQEMEDGYDPCVVVMRVWDRPYFQTFNFIEDTEYLNED